MKKKILSFLFIIISFIIFPNIALAETGQCGVLRYDITDLSIRDDKITLKGWAFVTCTHNYRNYDGRKGKSDSNITKTGGDQRIKIRAIDKNVAQLDVKEVNGGTIDGINYNFYCQQYYFYKQKSECENSYIGEFLSEAKKLGWNNKCENGKKNSQCLYQDIGFSVTFNTSDWGTEDGEEIKFQIAVHNADYTQKYSQEYTGWETISLNSSIEAQNDSSNIKIKTNTQANKLKVLIPEGILRDVSGNYVIEDVNGNKGSCNEINKGYSYCNPYAWSTAAQYTEDQDNVYTIADYPGGNGTANGFKNGYKKSSIDGFKVLNSTTHSPGEYVVYVNSTYTLTGTQNNYSMIRYPGDEKKQMVVYASWVKPQGEFAIKVYNDKKCKPSNPNIKAACNSTSDSFKSTCEELTVNVKDNNNEIKSKANVKIEQSGIISTILTPTKTYAGGGFKFGIIYYNTIKWTLGNQLKGNKEDITEAMKNKLVSIDEFKNKFAIKSAQFGNETIPDNYFTQNIQCQESGNFTDGETLTTMCIVYLPNSVLEEYTGKVNYRTDKNNQGLNNKYYTPLNWDTSKKYEIIATITGMDRLKESSAKNDSKDKNKSWTGTWEYKLNGANDNCSLNLYPLYSTPSKDKGSNKYVFIYRPIDITNPFPSRNPGMNWYDWYNRKIPNNKERLANSYSNDKLQYSTTLDGLSTKEIKQYNKDELKHGGYFDWKTMNSDKSTFIDKYFDTIKRENIIKE